MRPAAALVEGDTGVRQMLCGGLLSGDQSIKTAINVVVLSVTPW